MAWWEDEYDDEAEREAVALEREAEREAEEQERERARGAHFDAELDAYQAAQRREEEHRPREAAVEEFETTQAEADALDTYVLRCVICGKKVTGPQWREAIGPGHIYSDAGRREFSRTGICEWCFDKATDDMEALR